MPFALMAFSLFDFNAIMDAEAPISLSMRGATFVRYWMIPVLLHTHFKRLDESLFRRQIKITKKAYSICQSASKVRFHIDSSFFNCLLLHLSVVFHGTHFFLFLLFVIGNSQPNIKQNE